MTTTATTDLLRRPGARLAFDDPDADSPVPLRVADLAALIEHVLSERAGRDTATLLGSSDGAVVALGLAQERPDLVAAESDDQLGDHTSRALADGLGLLPERFPGGHTRVHGGPAGFEARIRALLGRW